MGTAEADEALALRIAALCASQERLASLVCGPTAPSLDAQSYAAEWSVAQVLAHLGAQAEVFDQFLTAGLTGGAAPGAEAFPPIWDVWNAKPPAAQAEDSVAANAALLGSIESLGYDERVTWRLSMFGMDLDLAGLVELRLAELTVHTWDVHVATDHAATLVAEAVPPLLDALLGLTGRLGHPVQDVVGQMQIVTHAPDRAFTLTVTDSVALVTDRPTVPAPGRITLPAEALVRLVYGRLDPAHTPASVTTDIDLDVLRRVFPGP
jgi:uncharacterized protein (TIGR03083 family)